jgi:G patch domain-containing protein 1
MDEEDLAEMRDSQKLVDTTEEMDLTGGTAAEMRKRAGPSSEKEYVRVLFIQL